MLYIKFNLCNYVKLFVLLFKHNFYFSGAHVNPAVTLGVTLGGGLKPIMAIPYVFSQLIGAIIGAGLCRVFIALYSTVNKLTQVPEILQYHLFDSKNIELVSVHQ